MKVNNGLKAATLNLIESNFFEDASSPGISHFVLGLKKKYCLFPTYQNMCDPNSFYGFQKKKKKKIFLGNA